MPPSNASSPRPSRGTRCGCWPTASCPTTSTSCSGPARMASSPQFMRWLTVTHTQRWHAHHRTAGTGHLYQGRFKSFPVESDEHFLTVCRYVERNALRANLVERAEDWRWGSLGARRAKGDADRPALSPWPIDRPRDWTARVNRAFGPKEEEAVRPEHPAGPAVRFGIVAGGGGGPPRAGVAVPPSRSSPKVALTPFAAPPFAALSPPDRPLPWNAVPAGGGRVLACFGTGRSTINRRTSARRTATTTRRRTVTRTTVSAPPAPGAGASSRTAGIRAWSDHLGACRQVQAAVPCRAGLTGPAE